MWTEIQKPSGGFSFINYIPIALGTEFRGSDQDFFVGFKMMQMTSDLRVFIDVSGFHESFPTNFSQFRIHLAHDQG
jgi:hypothetical protein